MKRAAFLEEIDRQFEVLPLCGLLGARQVGKTTLAKHYAEKFSAVHFFDLENTHDLEKLENPLLALSEIESGLIIIDEIQRRPDFFPILRVLVDEHKPRKFLILGSASRELLQQSSESLAGRIGYLELPPFSVEEVGDQKKLWLRGGYPLSYLADSDEKSSVWRDAYIATVVERDIPALGFNVPAAQIQRLWMMLAHNHGGMLNLSQLANSLGITPPTVRKYVDILAGTFMVRLLQPWFENISKRQVKLPKVYIRDSGIIHTLLGIHTAEELRNRPQLGALWEGFALEEIIKEYQARYYECFFWRTANGAELDLLIVKDGKKIGFEIKYSDTPKVTQSMHIALENLQLDHLYIVTPQGDTYKRADKITARSLHRRKE